ncbi:PepSY domain-containing protein [Alkalicoccobacillus gibsonii]|uniref:PepSY domain-containing protein n=1 Tax=Alkalicoccobacillus gibsonii TaxID=79881 RepID=UPI003F7B45E2
MIKHPIRMVLYVAALAAIGFVIYLLFPDSDSSLTLEEATEQIEAQYGSTPTEITLDDSVYTAVIERKEGLYKVELSEETGFILSLVSIETNPGQPIGEFISVSDARELILKLLPPSASIKDLELIEEENPPIWQAEIEYMDRDGDIDLHAETGEVIRNTLEEEQETSYLSEQEAIDIALKEINGIVDDVDLEESDGRMVYEVDIEDQETDEDVTVVIDAVTGQIIQFEY